MVRGWLRPSQARWHLRRSAHARFDQTLEKAETGLVPTWSDEIAQQLNSSLPALASQPASKHEQETLACPCMGHLKLFLPSSLSTLTHTTSTHPTPRTVNPFRTHHDRP